MQSRQAKSPPLVSVPDAGNRFLSALQKAGVLAIIAAGFAIGLTATIYLSLRSPEVKVPDVTGRNSLTGESMLENAGLSMHQRATRYSADQKPDTILDQSPRAGEVVKEGQTVAVVVTRAETRDGESDSLGQPSMQPTMAHIPGDSGEDQTGDLSSSSGNTNEHRRKKPRSQNTNNSNQNDAVTRTIKKNSNVARTEVDIHPVAAATPPESTTRNTNASSSGSAVRTAIMKNTDRLPPKLVPSHQ